MQILKRAVDMSHDIISNVLKDGDIAVDCTAGNGNDTAFLARLVDEEGKVYSFDIQDQAIKNTKQKLSGLGLIDRVKIINDTHENIDKYVKDEISAAMYNLGYLPGGNHSIITTSHSTIFSLEKVLNLLKVGGVVTIAIYYGHEGGNEEKGDLVEFVSKLDQRYYAVQKTEFLNFVNNPPIFICIEKLG